MAQGVATLANLWGEASAGASNSAATSQSRVTSVPAAAPKTEVRADLVKFYRDHGMENMAKEAGLIDSNGELSSLKSQAHKFSMKVAGLSTVITVPIAATATQLKMSPFKSEPAILPKTMHLSSSPVILGTPQRVVTSTAQVLGNSPRTPQQVLSPLVEQPGNWSGKRPYDLHDSDFSESKRSKKGEKGGKGLRHFSMKVCEKVQKKGTTSYNEVADELVAEFSDPQRHMSPMDQVELHAYDQKNIRRRVYDALNVLMAMNIISKEKKEIKWLGLPTNSAQECQNLELEKQRRSERIRVKTQQVQDLILQIIAFKNVVERNKLREKQQPPLAPNSTIHLPFIIVDTSKKTVIDCSISNDKMEYLFNFDNTFEIHDDIEVLKRMGLAFNLDQGTCTPEDLEKARQMVPKALEPYVIQMAQGSSEVDPLARCSSSSKDASGVDLMSSSGQGTDGIDAEIALATSRMSGLSRQSSVGSLSDLQSRPGTSTPSDDYSDCDSEPSSSGDVN